MSIGSATRNSSIRDCTAIKGAKAVQLRAQKLKFEVKFLRDWSSLRNQAPDFLPKNDPVSPGVLFRCVIAKSTAVPICVVG